MDAKVMKTLLLNIRPEGRADHYVVDVDVDDVQKSFVAQASSDGSVYFYDREYGVMRRHRPLLGDIVPLIVRFHEGERLQFPIDLHKDI
ncbi:Hypothetical protein A7982_09288 [Minicystis rosea]|nr:Hypothetical protein A7982_09288 [Minicystis rosea]